MAEEKKDQEQQDKNVEMIEKLKADFEAKLAEKDERYTALLETYIKKTTSSDDKQQPPEPTEAEKAKRIGELSKLVRDNKINALEQAKAMIEIDDYVTERGERSIFAYTHGAIDGAEIESVRKVKEILKDAIERSDGDVGVFQSAIVSKLAEFR